MIDLIRVLIPIMLLALPADALTAKFDVGDTVADFALEAINPDVVGVRILALETFVGPHATDRKDAVVLSFFAADCEPCKREVPFLAALHEEYADRGVVVISIAIDRESSAIDVAEDLMERSGARFPMLSDRFTIVAKRYGVKTLPLVYVIDREGTATMVKSGRTDDSSRAILNGVRALIGEPTSNPVPAALAARMPGAEKQDDRVSNGSSGRR